MREITLGQYYPVNSPIHRLDARIKLIITVMYIASIFFIKEFMVYGLILLFLAVVIALSKVPLLRVLKSLKIIIFLVLFTFIMTVFFSTSKDDLLWSFWIIKIYKDALINAAFISIRLIFLVLGPTMMTYTTTPVELTDGIESLLKPLSVIKFPVHELAIIMQIALRLIPTFVEETDKITSAQKARGADFGSGNIFKRAKAMIPILIPLFVSAFRRADDLADAMDSRCYRGAKGRTRMKKMQVKLKDFAALFVMLLLVFLILWCRFNFLPGIVDFAALDWFV